MADVWEQQPGETDKNYAAFLVYAELPIKAPEGEDSRSLAAVARKMGYKDNTYPGVLSSRFGWVNRVRAWDEHKRSTSISLRQVGMVEYEQAVIDSLTGNLAKADMVIERMMRGLLAMDFVPPREALRMVQVIREKDNLARRAAGMPIEFKTQDAEFEENEAERTYQLGGDE